MKRNGCHGKMRELRDELRTEESIRSVKDRVSEYEMRYMRKERGGLVEERTASRNMEKRMKRNGCHGKMRELRVN